MQSLLAVVAAAAAAADDDEELHSTTNDTSNFSRFYETQFKQQLTLEAVASKVEVKHN